MKLSKVSDEYLVDYLKIPTYDTQAQIASEAAKSFIRNYTGLTDREIDKNEDITTAYLVLVSDFYDNRQYITDRNYSNKAVETILNMHRRNLIPRGGNDV